MTYPRPIEELDFPQDKPWLVLGKGPTFSRIHDIHIESYYTLGMNRVPDVCNVTVFHAIDIDTNLSADSQAIIRADSVVLPWHPHTQCKPTTKTIVHLASEKTPWGKLISRAIKLRKCYWYNLSTWKGQHNPASSIVVKARFFSAEAIFNILGYRGIRTIFTLGIDGGTDYATEFKHIRPFKNGRNNFDVQMPEIKRACKRWGIKWVRL